tara:strand:+ start:1889 stop:2137 length:249 start_codon:yes stop_codon:yes gene_type:complete
MTYHFSNWSEILKTHRESQSYSLLELSNKTGVSRNTLIELEKGSKNIQEKTIVKLENYFENFMQEEEVRKITKKPVLRLVKT